MTEFPLGSVTVKRVWPALKRVIRGNPAMGSLPYFCRRASLNIRCSGSTSERTTQQVEYPVLGLEALEPEQVHLAPALADHGVLVGRLLLVRHREPQRPVEVQRL